MQYIPLSFVFEIVGISLEVDVPYVVYESVCPIQ